jgi:hypothetical protein
LLIILLVMSVVLTTVLSIVSRSVTDISITTYEDESVRALTAAEAGVEEAFISGLGTPPLNVDLDTKTSFTTAVTASGISTNEFAHPVKLLSGETATFWMVSHDASGDLVCDLSSGQPCFTGDQIGVYWGKSDTEENQDFTPAVAVSIYYDSGVGQPSIATPPDFSSVDVVRAAFDPHDTRFLSNSFTNVAVGNYSLGGREFGFMGTVDISSASHLISCRDTDGCILMVRVRMFYNLSEMPVGINVITSGVGALPAQGITIDSTGTSGDSTRKLQVFRSFPEPPVVFDSSLFSYGDLIK